MSIICAHFVADIPWFFPFVACSQHSFECDYNRPLFCWFSLSPLFGISHQLDFLLPSHPHLWVETKRHFFQFGINFNFNFNWRNHSACQTQIRSCYLPTQKCDLLTDRHFTFPRSPFQMFRFLMITILLEVQRCFKGRKRRCAKGRKEVPAKKKGKCKNHHVDEKEGGIESPALNTRRAVQEKKEERRKNESLMYGRPAECRGTS